MEKNPNVIMEDSQGHFTTDAKPKSRVKCVYIGFLYFHKFGLNINTYYIYNDAILKIGQGIFYEKTELSSSRESSVIRKTEVRKK